MTTGWSEPPAALGIIAGGGGFPAEIAEAALASGRRVFVVGLQGNADAEVISKYPHEFARIGAIGKIRGLLEANGCRDVVMVGRVRRPSIRDLRPDAEGMKFLARIGVAAFSGDDRILGAVVRLLGEDGFRVVGAHEVMTSALAPAGLLTEAAPDEQALADIARGREVALALGAVDVGQGCVVQQGLVLAVEAIEGTDAMLARAGPLARSGPGGVLVKMAKPGQELRADLPALGPATVAAAHAAGLRGIAYSAGGALLAERERMVSDAGRAGIFLIGID